MNVWLEPVVSARQAFFDRPVRLVVDVGSRDGDDAAFLLGALGGTDAICIEARPAAAATIRERYPEFRVIETAVSDVAGSREFLEFLGEDPGLTGSSSFNLDRMHFYGGDKPSRVITVPVERLDALLPEGLIDVLKIDVEGHTLEALAGLGTRLKDVLVAHLETETIVREVEWGEPANNLEVAAIMKGAGFFLVASRYEWGPTIEDQTWVNAGHADVESVKQWFTDLGQQYPRRFGAIR